PVICPSLSFIGPAQSPVLLGLANYSIGARERPERISNAPHIIYLPASPPPPPPSLDIAPGPESSFTISLADPLVLQAIEQKVDGAVHKWQLDDQAVPPIVRPEVPPTATTSSTLAPLQSHEVDGSFAALSRKEYSTTSPSASSSSLTAEALRAEADLNVSYGAEPAFERPATATPPSSSSSSCEVDISYGLEHAFEEPAPISRSQILSRVEDAKARLYERHFWLRAEMGVLERELADLRDQSARVKADVDERQWEYGFLTDDQLAASLPPFSPLFRPRSPLASPPHPPPWSTSNTAQRLRRWRRQAPRHIRLPGAGWAAPEAEVRAASEAEVRVVRRHAFDRIALGRSNLPAATVVVGGEEDKEEGTSRAKVRRTRRENAPTPRKGKERA
ncbi:hypothetical protein B0H13DRAFT_2023373, partial [Mycena leptocephala]